MGKSYRLKNLYFSILPSNKNRCKLHIQWEIYIFREILYDNIVNKLKEKTVKYQDLRHIYFNLHLLDSSLGQSMHQPEAGVFDLPPNFLNCSYKFKYFLLVGCVKILLVWKNMNNS